MTDPRTLATAQNWDGVYPEQVDGYAVFARLAGGETVPLEVNGDRFELTFEGDEVGYDCSLVVKNAQNRVRRYGWGQRVEHVYQALEEANLGWNTPQVYRFKSYRTLNTHETQLV